MILVTGATGTAGREDAAPTIASRGALCELMKDLKVSLVDVRDVAAVAAENVIGCFLATSATTSVTRDPCRSVT